MSPIAGITIERYMAFSHLTHRLLLRNIGNNTRRRLARTHSKADLKREIRDEMARHQIAGNYLSFRKYCQDHWLVRFASEANATALVLECIDLRGAVWQLEPFQNERWQVYVCKQVPKTVRYNLLFTGLAAATAHFDDTGDITFYAKGSQRKKHKRRSYACMYVMLNCPTDVKSFTIDCDGDDQVQFDAWLGDSMCPLCNEEHCLLTCDQFVPPKLPRKMKKPAGMTYERPPAMIRLGGLAWT